MFVSLFTNHLEGDPQLDVDDVMMFIGTETLVTQLVYERSRMHADRKVVVVVFIGTQI